LAPSNTEILYALGAQDSIIATTRFCDYPAAAISKPKISGWSDVDAKKVAALKPDLVLTSSIVQAKTAQALREAGVNVTHIDPKTIDEVMETFTKVGYSVNRAATGRELAYNVRDKLAVMSKCCNYGKKIYVEEWHKPPTASANWVPDMLTLLGCKAITRSGIISHEVTTEQVAQFDPDAIVLSWCGFGTKADANQLLEREGWDGLRAVQNNNVFIVDDSFLNRPGPRLVEGLRVLKEIASRC
jgi:iron complex transport system substrate-binding protein